VVITSSWQSVSSSYSDWHLMLGLLYWTNNSHLSLRV
jgi:hypothetical protein